MKVLVIGFNTRHIACSARRAGHTVYSLGRFDDIDLGDCSDISVTHDMPDVHNLDLSGAVPHIKTLLPADAVVLGPGFEHQLDWIDSITGGSVPILNNQPQIFLQTSDKLTLSGKLKIMGIPHPYTQSLDSLDVPDDWKGGFPALMKPRFGAGGVENKLIGNDGELAGVLELPDSQKKQYLLQEYITGPVVSVSLVSTGKQAADVAVNENLVGIHEFTDMPFAYCGNITPYNSKYHQWMCDIAVELALELELVGSNGVDFIITDKGPVVLEVNPRIQGSIDTVEKSTGINIFEAHYNSFRGILPKPAQYRCYSIRTVFYAPYRFTVNNKIYEYLRQCLELGKAADVPSKGTLCEKDEPVVSFILSGDNHSDVFRHAFHLAAGLKDRLDENYTKD